MKKLFLILSLLFASILVLFGIASCKKSALTADSGKSSDISPKVLSLDSTSDRVFDAGNFFTPDYTPYEAEPESKAGKIKLFWPKAGGKAESIVPGLRKLSDYQTSYKTRKSDLNLSELAKMVGEQDSAEKSPIKSQPLKIIWSAPGYSKNKWIDSNEVAPEFSHELRVQFNYPVTSDEIKDISKIEFYKGDEKNGSPIQFKLKQESIDTITYFWEENIPFESKVILTVEQNLDGKKITARANFSTLSPFIYEDKSSGRSYGKYTNPLCLYFSHPVDYESVLTSVSAKKASGEELSLTKENIEVRGGCLKIFALPLSFHSKYSVQISKNLKDIYGRKLSSDDKKGIELEIEVPGAESKVSFTDSGVRMLESNFPHRMVFEYQNIFEGAYVLNRTENPFAVTDWSKIKASVYDEKNESLRTNLESYPKDERIFKIINLDEKLSGGKGWTEIYSAIKLPKKPTKWDPETFYWSTNATSIQVTNLGVTVRYAMNKVCVLVTQLSDGRAVEGARVFAYADKNASTKEIINNAPLAVTDKNGLALINLSQEDSPKVISGGWWDAPVIYVVKDDDRVIFQPDDHSPWRSGIYSYSKVPNKIEAEQRTFMFSDRGLYKPGERASFRGIDRDQVLGSFIPYSGNYTVTLMEDKWRDSKEYGKLTGKASESGGFYGSFEIPEDIEPGICKIRYQRDGDEKSQELRINVAFFEKVKFQSEVSMPKTPVIAGEKIQAGIGASYLAGGALSSAKFETNWFREPWYFTSDEAEFRQYKFGPINSQEGRSHIREDSGSLDSNGSATVSCETSGNSIKGAPYRYRVSADITDISNQQISASAATVVHPASFYIGLSKPEMSSAFAKKGEKITFTYKLALPDGKALASSKSLGALAGKDRKIEVKLTRDEWNLVQQQGIYDIYSRYEKTEIEESCQTVALDESGKISVTALEAGNHKIQLSAMDSQGRPVITEYEFFVTGSGRCSWYQDDATSLRLTPDKNQYNPGETAHLLLESTLPEGNYLITVEREGIFTEEVRHLEGSVNVIDIPVARNYVPVFYVSISSYSVRQGEPKHEYGEADLDKPKGFYGAAEVFVNPRVKSFSVKLESKKPSYRPGEMAEVTIYATKGGKPLANSEITLMAVDRGVLDLINYHVPDPIAFFYSKANFPLRVKGGDSRAYLMDPVTYEVKNLKGGDNGDDEKINERSDFNPTAVFEPMLKTDENGRATVSFKLPDNLTTYRLTAFGVNGELLALQEDEIAVQNPINIQQILPRQLRERDTSEVGVLISNLDDREHEITVSLAVGEIDAAKAEEKGITRKAGQAFVDGKREHKIKVPSRANASVFFDIAAKKAGMVSTEFTVKSDILNEKLICPLKIEKPYIFETVTKTGQLSESEESATEKITIPSYTEDMNGSLSVTLDATRLGLLGNSVQYLFEYPFGCLEQQSSRLLPLVIFEDYIDAFNLESQVTNIRKVVKSCFASWKNCQHSDGGFGYWPTSYASNAFVSARIAHIYALAIQRGYKEKDLAIDIEKLCKYISENSGDDYSRAYNYYVLALNGKAVSDEKLEKIIRQEKQELDALALAGLCSLEKDGKDSLLAKEAASEIRTLMRPASRGVDLAIPASSSGRYAYYGDESEKLALILQLFTQLDKDDETNTRLIYSLMSKQRAGYWKNTATTARVLEAIYHVIKTNNLDKTNLNATALFQGKQFASGTFKGAAARPVTVTLPFTDEKISSLKKDRELALDFSKKGKGSLYYTASMRYAIPQELQEAKDKGIGLVMQLFDNATGEEIKVSKENPVTELESGKTYKVKITLSSNYDRDYLALRAPVPSGAEILDATFVTSPEAAKNASGKEVYSDDGDGDSEFWGGSHFMSNQVIYNSEIHFFWDSFKMGKTTAEFKFRAVRRGVFPTPPANAECMYEPETFGRTGGILYTIK